MGKSKNTKKKKELSARDWLIIVGVIFFIILTLGLFFWQKEKEQEQKFIDLEKKKNRLLFVTGEIVKLEKKKHALEQIEKSTLIGGRALIGLLLISANIWFNYYPLYPFDFTQLLDFNGAILLGYSFIAFISYGTPTNFAKNIKKRISDYSKRHRIDSLAELEQLLIERETLISEIHILEEVDLIDKLDNK